MTAVEVDLEAALRIARAATPQRWHVDKLGSCGDQSIADVGGVEVCAPQSMIWSDGVEHEAIHARDAEADAVHIAAFDPPTAEALCVLALELQAANARLADLSLYLLRHALILDSPGLVGECPESCRSMLEGLVAPRLALVDRSG